MIIISPFLLDHNQYIPIDALYLDNCKFNWCVSLFLQ